MTGGENKEGNSKNNTVKPCYFSHIWGFGTVQTTGKELNKKVNALGLTKSFRVFFFVGIFSNYQPL